MNKSIGTPGPGDRSLSEDKSDIIDIREIWDRQGVGKDGYLTFDELGIICENMGMGKMNDAVSDQYCLLLTHLNGFLCLIVRKLKTPDTAFQ